MAIGFFDGQKADASPESIKRKRAMIAQLLSGGRAPRDVGEGLHAIGRGLQAAVLGSRADAAEQASNASSAEAMRGIYSGFGSPMASAGNPVATGSGATRVVAAPEQFAQLFAENEAKHSLPQGYLARAAQIESNFNPSAKNPNSSAGGIFQFIDSTARQYGLRNRFDPVEATAAAARLAADNRDFLARRLGREPSAGELYLAHQQGAGGAAKLLANPDALASSVVGNAAARLNRGAGMTAGAFANQWINKFGTPVVRPGPGATPMPLQTASAGPQSNDAQMQDGAGELQAGGSEMMGGGYNPFLPRDMAPPADAMGQGIAENEEQTRIMEAQMAAEQGLPYAGNEPGQFNSMFSPDLMGGGLNPFVPRDMVQPEDAIAQAPVPMPPQMDRATFDQVTAGLPQRAPAFAGQGLAPSWAGDPDKLAPGAEQASFVIPARDTVALPAANNRPPQSPFVPPAMRAPLPVDMGGENSGGSAMQFIESEFARREGRPDPRTAMGAPQGYNPFVQQPTQAPQMPAGGGSVQGVSQGDTMAGGAAQAPAQASNRIAELASIAGNPMVRPEVRQLAMAEIQTERARAQAEADRVRTQAQNNDTADALKIDRRLGGVAPAVAAAAKANFDRKFGQAKRSLQPVYGTDAQGNTVVLQLGDDGTVVQPQLPKDVKIATGVDKVDTGTEFVFMDKRTGAVVGRQPKDVAGAERAKVIGKDQGEGVTNAPAALATADQTLAAIDGVLNDKNLGWATGAPGIVTRNVPGTPTFGTGQRIEQLQGRAFLQAFESLKGGGAITEIEGQKATQAIARLNARQSEKDFREALKELRDIVATGRARAAAKAEQGGGQPSPQAGQASAALQNARKAIADGAPRQAVIDRLRQAGIDPGGL